MTGQLGIRIMGLRVELQLSL